MKERKNKTQQEIHLMVAENRAKLQAFRFVMSGSKQKNVKEGRNIRKEIARLLTELSALATK